jgi:hypothetical protein
MKELKSKQPKGCLLNPDFEYKNSASTNLRETFARVRKRQGESALERARSRIIQLKKLTTGEGS